MARGLVAESFVAVAGSDVAYNEHPDQISWEVRHLRQSLEGAPHGLHQGIYVVTSSGRYLGQINAGWPEPDPVEASRRLRAALSAYQSMSRAQRTFSGQVPAGVRFPWSDFRLPEGGLNLRVTKRSYPYQGMTTFDERHPTYVALDRLWFKPSEWRQFLPRDLRPGASADLSSLVGQRLVTNTHLMKDCSPWEEGQQFRVTSRVASVEGDVVTLRLEGEFHLKANTQWNRGRYDGMLLGVAVFDRSADKWTRFEWVTLGTHTAGERRDNMHAGDLTSQVATFVTLNPLVDPDDDLPPANWMYGYPRGWAASR